MNLELVGPPGAGKSTLGNLLSYNNDVRCEKDLVYYRNMREAPFLAKNLLLLLPLLIRLYGDPSRASLTREEIVWMVILNGYHKKVARMSQKSAAVILDQGPIYYMTSLHMYQIFRQISRKNNISIPDDLPVIQLGYSYSMGDKLPYGNYADKWWKWMYKTYANILDTIIWLDAPDKVLIDRVRSRQIRHGIKTKSDQGSILFLDNLRRAYELVIDCLKTEVPQLSVIRFNTETETINDLSEKVLTISRTGVRLLQRQRR